MAGIPVVSPDISVLNNAVLFDLSGPAASITITNQSTITNPHNLTWWFVITSPSGIPLHTGSLATPDKTAAVGWSFNQTWLMPNPWLSPFTPPTIEFSCSVPYTVVVYVQDSVGNTFSQTFSQTICKPNGNDVAGYNFGLAGTNIQVQCASQRVYATDTTVYTYQGIIGSSSANIWTMTYPADSFGTVPPNWTASNQAYVFIPVGYNGTGYTLNFSTYCVYAFPNGCSIKIQYKVNKSFAVLCGIDLCKMVCDMKRLYIETNTRCGQILDDNAISTMNRISYLMSMILASIVQPACDNDTMWMIKEAQKLIGAEGCGCTEASIGVNGASTTGSTCCPPTSGTSSASPVCAVPTCTFTLPTVVPPPWITTTTITVNFTPVAGVAYEVWILPHPSSVTALPFAGTPVTGGSYTFSVHTITTYDIYIRAICSGTSSSAWTLAGTVTSL